MSVKNKMELNKQIKTLGLVGVLGLANPVNAGLEIGIVDNNSNTDTFVEQYNAQFNKTFKDLTYRESSIFTLGELTYGNYTVMDYLFEIDEDGKSKFKSRGGGNGFRNQNNLKFENSGLCELSTSFKHRDKSNRAKFSKKVDGTAYEVIETTDFPVFDFASKLSSVQQFDTNRGINVSLYSPISSSTYRQLSGKFSNSNQFGSHKLYNIRFEDDKVDFGKETFQNLNELLMMCKQNSDLVTRHRNSN